MSLAALRYGAETMQSLCEPDDETPLCGMSLQRWSELITQIEELGEIESGSVTPTDCFDASFLPGPGDAPL